MSDWATISSLATAGGTLVLAVATFGSIRSANRAARVAERSMLTQQRPILVPSRDNDLTERVRFGDGEVLEVGGHGAKLVVANGNVYLALALRNGGSGLAVLHGWRTELRHPRNEPQDQIQPDPDGFRRQTRDLYIPAGDTGFWQGAIRDPADPEHAVIRAAIERGDRIVIDLLYGDLEGGQRTIVRFTAASDRAAESEANRAEVGRYWNIDGSAPR